MPITVIHNGKTYYEYSIHELEARRLRTDTHRMLTRGQAKFTSSPYTDTVGCGGDLPRRKSFRRR